MPDRIPVLNKRFDTIPEGAVYIGRPSPWGNPYSHKDGTLAKWSVETREKAISAFRRWIEQIAEIDPSAFDDLLDATALVCWCAPNSCHGDVLADFLEQRRAQLGRWEDMMAEEA